MLAPACIILRSGRHSRLLRPRRRRRKVNGLRPSRPVHSRAVFLGTRRLEQWLQMQKAAKRREQ
jgi:hypothetical protein